MRKAVFLLGTPEWRAVRNSESLTDFVFSHLDRIAAENDLDASVVFAVADSYWASKSKTDIGMERIRAERPRVLEEIANSGADLIVAFGPVAAASLFDRGDLTEGSLQRRKFNPLPRGDDPGPDAYYTSSVEQIRMAPGMVEWWGLDVAAACRGYDKPAVDEWHLNQRAASIESALRGDLSLVGFDLETTGLDPWAPDAAIRMVVLAWRDCGSLSTWVFDWDTRPTWVDGLLANPESRKVGANIAFDVKWCRRFGVAVNNYADVLTQEHVLFPGNPRLTLKDLGFKYFPQVANYNFEVERLAREAGGDWSKIRAEDMYEYCAADGQVSLVAAEEQAKLLGAQRPVDLMNRLYPILTNMSIAGACVDMHTNHELDAMYTERLTQLKLEIAQHLGPINPDSPPQLAKALKEHVPGIDLSVRRLRKALDDDRKVGGVGSSASYDAEDEDVSTDRQTLERESEKHPVIGLILEYRKYRVRHSTFIQGVREKHAVRHHGKDWIHPDFRSDVTDTYRLSSRNPNGQNLPKNEKDEKYSVKRQFVSRFNDGRILDIDMSQIELRVAAWFSDDETMRAAFAAGADIHSSMAAQMLAKDAADVSPTERQEAKSRTFLIMYGGGANKLAQALKCTVARAGRLIRQYFDTYTGLERAIGEVHANVARDLGVTTPFGFRRAFFPPERWMSSDGFQVKRQAWNTIIQNTAACLMYCAMIRFDELHVGRAVPFLQVHDSLVVDCPRNEVDEVARLLLRSFREAPLVAERYGVRFDMDIEAEVKIGSNWGNTTKLEVV